MKHIITLTLLATTLVACQDKVAHNATPHAEDKAAAQQTGYPGKPTAPVQISYQLDKNIQLGIPLTITLKITPTVVAQQITVHYTTEGALTSGDPQPHFQFGNTAAGATIEQTITVIPQAEGRHRVIVSVNIQSDHGRSGSRSMSIPVVLGNVPQGNLKPQGATVTTDPQGKQVIVTPAQEEIIKH